MSTTIARALFTVCLTTSVFSECIADDAGYWSLKLPVPESATHVTEETNLDFLTRSVSFDWRGDDTSVIRNFYSQYFESIGWQDPLAGSAGFPNFRAGGWSSYGMRFDENSRPLAAYSTVWKAKDYPAYGAVQVTLDGLEGDELIGSVIVQVTPEVDTSVLLKLNGLVGDDPKNLFKLHNAVHGNPFELHTIALPANYEDETDPLLAEYYRIVDQIRQVYENWRLEYVSP